MSELIDVLLAESELPDDAVLRDLLGELEREATAVRPMPSAALSELMSPRRATPSHAHTRGARRRPSFAGRGAVITGVVVIGVLGLGAGAAAASPEARSAIGAGVAVIAHLFDPPATAANTPRSVPGSAGDATPTPDGTESPDPTQSPEPTQRPQPSPSATPSPSDDGSDGHGKSGETHGNGKGNQSGHGNGKGQGNGGPAPTK